MTAYRASQGPPATQPYVVLACKCTVHAWPVFCSLGGHRPEAYCERHGGWSRIKRQADLTDIIAGLEIEKGDNQECLF